MSTRKQKKSLEEFKSSYLKKMRKIRDFVNGETPCESCGHYYDDHDHMTAKDIALAEKNGCVVKICEDGPEKTLDCPEVSLVIVTLPPESPCDEEFMEGISS